MNKKIFFDILDASRKKLLPFLKNFEEDFYLAGGTGLALQLGHRLSLDFDFFSPKSFSPEKLFKKIVQKFSGRVKKIQEEKGTLEVLLPDQARLAFLAYPYRMVGRFVESEYLRIASIEDIGCMKLSAITGRAVNKDYIDLYFILQKISLDKLLKLAVKKFPEVEDTLFLKSLVYFDDIEKEPIVFRQNKRADFFQVKKFLSQEAKKLFN